MNNRSRTASFSSSSSSSSSSYSSSSSSLQRCCSFPCNEPEPPFFPSGVIPFSWEHQPGIPKNHHAAPPLQRTNSASFSGGRLPLPPSSTTTPTKSGNSPWKKSSGKKSQRDPFAAAMVQCSKDDEGGVVEGGLFRVGAKLLSRSLSGRLGVIVSCKQNCAVSEAIVRIPAASRIIDAPTRLL